MTSLLSFVSTAPISGLSRPCTNLNPPSQPSELTSWGLSGSTCATISAGISLAALASGTKHRKGRVQSLALSAFDPTTQPGAMAPLGYWDPLSLMREGFKNPDGGFKDEETFNWYRAAEIKHGRIAMMATTGVIMGTFFKFGGFESVPAGFGALDTSLGGAGMGIILIITGTLEFIYPQDPAREPGNLGNVWFVGEEEEWREIYTTELRNRELAHCRLAMSGVLVQFLYEYAGVGPEEFLSVKINPALFPAFLLVLGALSQFKDEKDWAEVPPAAKQLKQ